MTNTVNKWNGLGPKTPKLWTNGTSRLKRDPKGALAKTYRTIRKNEKGKGQNPKPTINGESRLK